LSGSEGCARFSLVSGSDEETERLGESLGAALRGGDVLFAEGPLGSGKTCLIRGICAGLGFSGRVRSPSFAVICRYDGRLTVYHVDLYRIPDNSPELEDLSRQEYFSRDAVTLIEWGGKLRAWGVSPSLLVCMEPGDAGTRRITVVVEDVDLADRLKHAFDGY
jgi:tRNA threonylcarbamoyladenosine biosynthesis protein TsaE